MYWNQILIKYPGQMVNNQILFQLAQLKIEFFPHLIVISTQEGKIHFKLTMATFRHNPVSISKLA